MTLNFASTLKNCQHFFCSVLRGICFLALCTKPLDAEAETPKPPTSPPNVIVLLADDLGYGDLGCFGHLKIQSPHLDQLASEGARFTQLYSAAPVCSPARAGLMTGRTPTRLGIHDWIPAESEVALSRSEVTIAQQLKTAHYATGHFGKWHLHGRFDHTKLRRPADYGFDHWFATQNNAAPNHQNPTNFVRNGQRVGPLQGYSSDLIVDEAIGWIQQQPKDRPFFANIWFHATHEQIRTAPEFVKLYADEIEHQAEYFGNVTQMDHAIGRLLAELDQLGLSDNTLILFTSDNGPEALRRYPAGIRSFGSPHHFRGRKLHLHEGGIRVPGIIRWPAGIRPGQEITAPVHHCDLLPTLAQLSQTTLPVDRNYDGVSWEPLLSGQPLQREKPLYWHYSLALSAPFKTAIRVDDWKLLASQDLQEFELFNLADDPEETTPLNLQQPEKLEALKAQLLALHQEVVNDSLDSGNPLPGP